MSFCYCGAQFNVLGVYLAKYYMSLYFKFSLLLALQDITRAFYKKIQVESQVPELESEVQVGYSIEGASSLGGKQEEGEEVGE